MIRLYLITAGIIATGLGGMILFAPVAFYAGYGIEPAGQVNLLNELRSHGLAVLAAGFFATAAAFVGRLTLAAMIVTSALYLSYGLSRLVAILLDGMPSSSLLAAGAVELVLGLAGLGLLPRQRASH